jgi:GNAT superfamily N-acetyltransferase
MFLIRAASVPDIDVIAPLYRLLFREMAELQPNVWRPAEMPRSFLLELIEGGRSDILLALAGDETAGFAVVQDRDTPGFSCLIPARYVYLMDMVVAKGHRGKGAGSSLISAAEAWGRERGARWIELNALAENSGAIRLYKRSGLSFVQHTMRRMF